MRNSSPDIQFSLFTRITITCSSVPETLAALKITQIQWAAFVYLPTWGKHPAQTWVPWGLRCLPRDPAAFSSRSGCPYSRQLVFPDIRTIVLLTVHMDLIQRGQKVWGKTSVTCPDEPEVGLTRRNAVLELGAKKTSANNHCLSKHSSPKQTAQRRVRFLHRLTCPVNSSLKSADRRVGIVPWFQNKSHFGTEGAV